MTKTNIHSGQSTTVREKIKPVLLGTRHAADLCGISVKTWRTWDALGLIPAPVRIGKRLFWRRDDLLQWIAADCPRR